MAQNKVSQKVKARREKVRKLSARGLTQEQIADKLDVSRRTIARDQKAMRKNIQKIMSEKAEEEILDILETQMRSIIDEYWIDRHQKDSEKALDGIRKAINDYIKNLQKLGFVHEEPDKHEIEHSADKSIFKEIRKIRKGLEDE